MGNGGQPGLHSEFQSEKIVRKGRIQLRQAVDEPQWWSRVSQELHSGAGLRAQALTPALRWPRRKLPWLVPGGLVHSGDSVRCTCHPGSGSDRAEGASDSRRGWMTRSRSCSQEAEAKAAVGRSGGPPRELNPGLQLQTSKGLECSSVQKMDLTSARLLSSHRDLSRSVPQFPTNVEP